MNAKIGDSVVRGVVCAAFVVATPWLSAHADDAYWQPTAAGTYEWSEAANWKDGGGATPASAPMTADASAHFDIAADGAQTIKFFPLVSGDIPAESRNLAVGAVSGGSANHTIATRGRDWWGTYRTLVFSVLDPNGFLGRWATLDAYTTFELPGSTDSFTPCLNELSVHTHPYVSVPDGKVAKVASLIGGDTYVHSTWRKQGVFGAGELTKTGAGELQIGKIGEPDVLDRLNLRLRVKEGTLTLNGQADTEIGKPVPGAYFHVDATRTDTMTIVRQEDGRDHVTEWRDADGGSVKAVARAADASYNGGTPFLSSSASVSGKPMVDFGCFRMYNNGSYPQPSAEIVAALGPDALLDFDRSTDVKAVFYVFEYTMMTNCKPAIIGDNAGAYDFVHQEAMSGDNFGGLYTDYIQTKARDGTINVDGFLGYCGTQKNWSTMTLVNTRPNGACAASTFGRDRSWATGGFRLAEVLIYTNDLTAAECERNNRYLLAKWNGEAYPDLDCSAVASDSASAAINVPAGRTFKTGVLQADGGKIVKTGEGTLLFERLEPAWAALEVQAGRADFMSGRAAVTRLEPAVDPLLWLDAEADSFTEDANGISRWSDRRDGTSGTARPYATAYTGDVTYKPTRKTRADGKHYVDFGCGYYSGNGARPNSVGGTYGDSSCMDLLVANGSNKPLGYDAFVVVRQKWPSGDAGNMAYLNQLFFGSRDSLQFCRIQGNPTTLGCWLGQYAYANALAAEWACDGVPVDVFSACAIGTDAFHVVRISASEGLWFGAIARDGNWTIGGIEVAEEIIYNRQLTAAERADTEAYLMQKWLGKPHPTQEGRAVDKVVVPADEPAVFDSDEDVTIGQITGGNGAFVKSGDGKTTIKGTVDGLGINAIAVAGGELEASVGWLDDATYHFDASQSETLTTSVNGSTTNVLSWASANGNGAKAEGRIQYASKTYPTLTNVALRAGVNRTVLDFGGLSVHNTAIQTNNSAGLTVTCTGGDNVREYYAVRADANFDTPNHADTAYGNRWILTDTESIFSRHDYGYMFVGWSQTHLNALQNGLLMLDDTVVGTLYRWNDDLFHVFFCQPDCTQSDAPLKVRTIAFDRGVFGAGGCQYGEILAFSKTNSPAVSQYLRQKLRYKWLGEGEEPSFPNAPLTSMTVANGSALTLRGNPSLVTSTFGGAGTMTFGSVSGISNLSLTGPLAVSGDVTVAEGATISVEFPNVADYGRMAVDGTLTLPETVAGGVISVNFGPDAYKCSGRYPLFTATTREGAVKFSNWKIQAQGTVPKNLLRLVAEGNTVYLEFQRRGLVVVVY